MILMRALVGKWQSVELLGAHVRSGLMSVSFETCVEFLSMSVACVFWVMGRLHRAGSCCVAWCVSMSEWLGAEDVA